MGFIFIFIFMIFIHTIENIYGFEYGIASKVLYFLVIFSIYSISFFLVKNSIIKKNKFPRCFFYLILFIFYKIIIIMIYNNFYDEIFDIMGRGSLERINSFTIGMISWMFMGMGFCINLINVRDCDNINIFFLSLMLGILLFFVGGILPIDYSQINVDRENHVTHLTLNGFIILLCLFVQTQVSKFFNITVFLNILILFIVGGRSDFFVFLISILLYNIIFNFNLKKFKKNMYLKVFIGVLFFSIFISFLIEHLDRFILIFSGEDNSAQVRGELLINNIDNFKNLLLIGDPNFHTFKYNDSSAYIHNILSAWEFYGMIYFIILLYFLFTIMKFILNNRFFIKNEKGMRFMVLAYIFSLISLLFSKVIFYYPFWFSLGGMVFYISFYSKYTAIQDDFYN